MPPKKKDQLRITRALLARVFGVTEKTITRYGQEGMPKTNRTLGGFDVAACVQWKIAQVKARDADKIEELRDALAEDPEMAGGGKSPNLEKWRGHKAEIARMQKEQMEGDLILREDVHTGFGIIFPILNTMSQTIRDRFGAPAGKILDKGFAQMERKVKAHFGEPKPKEKDED